MEEKNVDINNYNLHEIKSIREEINKYEKINKLFTEDKLIEKLLNQIIENTEGIINNVLKDLTNFSLKFEINKEGISIYKKFNNELIDAKFLSGYEMFVSNIALRTNFMIIDEGFNSCSNTNIVKIDSAFNLIRRYYKWCIVVSHLDQIKDNFDKSYNITKIKETNDSQILIN